MALPPSKDLNRSTALMSAGIFISRIFGFLRDMVIGYFFTRTQTDAFFVAFRLPNFFRMFFGETAMTMSLVPTFIDYLHEDEELSKNKQARAKNLVNSVYTLLLVAVSTFTVLGIYFMDSILGWMFADRNFSTVEGKLEMTITLSRFLFSYLFLVVNYAYFTAIAQGLRRFFIPSLAPASVNLSIVLCVLILPEDLFAFHSMVLAVGVLIGGVIQMGLVATILIHLQFMPNPFSIFSFKDCKMVVQKFIPSMIGIGSFAVIGLANVYFAGWLEEGVHTYIYYAGRLLELPRALIAVSMGSTLLPFLSRLYTQGKQESLLHVAAKQRDLLLYIVVPAALGLFFLGAPIVEVLFARGEFDQLTSRKTAGVLQLYSWFLISLSLVQVLSTCYFVVKNTWYPALSTLTGLLVHIILAPILMHYWQLDGLIFSAILSSVIQLLILIAGYTYFIGSLHIWKSFINLLPLIPMWCLFSVYLHYAYLAFFFLLSLIFTSDLALGLTLFMTIITSIFIYIYAGVQLKLKQALECLDLIKIKLKFSTSK